MTAFFPWFYLSEDFCEKQFNNVVICSIFIIIGPKTKILGHTYWLIGLNFG